VSGLKGGGLIGGGVTVGFSKGTVGGLGRMGEYVGVAILQKRSCSNTLSLYKYVCVPPFCLMPPLQQPV